jgi:hypothetical protein
MTSKTPGFYLDLKLFLEGIEIPVISASVTSTVGQPASANIEVVPTDKLKLLLPRTTVHLFFLDSMEFLESGLNEPADEHYKLLFCGEVHSITFSNSGMGSRSGSLMCRDFSVVWDTSFSYSLNYNADANAQIGGNSAILNNNSVFLTTSQIAFDSIINSPSDIIGNLSRGNPESPALQSARNSSLGGLLNILETLSGAQGKFYGTSPWTTIQERRTRVLESIITDTGETAKSVYNTSQFSDWLRDRIAPAGDVMSFRETLRVILDYVFYDVVTNLTPTYVAGKSEVVPDAPNRDIPKYEVETDDSIDTVGTTGDTQIDELRADFRDIAVKFLEEVRAAVAKATLPSGNTSAKVVVTDALRERAEVVAILRSREGADPTEAQITSYELRSAHVNRVALDIQMIYETGRSARIGVAMPYRTNGPGEPIKDVASGETWYLRLRRIIASLAESGIRLSTVADLEARGPDASDFESIYRSQEDFKEDILTFKDFVVWGRIVQIIAARTPEIRSLAVTSETSRQDPLFILGNIGADPVHFELRNWRQSGAVSLGSVTPEGDSVAPATPSTPVSSSPRESLKTFIFRPDVWFVPPPACNVIYPDQLQSFLTQRDMLRETTRLQLDLGLEQTLSAAVKSVFYAPQFVSGDNLQDSIQSSSEGGSPNSILVYDHEKYSGIIPKFHAMDNVLFYKNLYQDGSSPEDVLMPSYETYARKVAHFRLLSERYEAKTGSASLAFSPFIVAGFPAVIVDASITVDETGSTDLSNRAFTLGMVNSVTHSITQGGAITSVVLTHVRTHRTGSQAEDQFFELIQNDATMTIQTGDRKVSTAQTWSLKSSIVRAMSAELKGADLAFWKLFEGTAGIYDIGEFLSSLPVATDATIVSPSDTFDTFEDISEPRISISPVPVLGGVINSGLWTGDYGTAVVVYFLKTGDAVQEVGIIPTESASVIVGELLGLLFDAGYPQTAYADASGNYFEVLIPIPKDTLVAEVVSEESLEGKLPVEEAIRPQWISKDYSAALDESGVSRLTSKIYKPFFESMSITDLVPESESLDGYAVRSIEQAVDWIAKQYSEATDTRSEAGADPLLYIDGVTRRPIANLPQVLGDKQVQLDSQGRVVRRVQNSGATLGPEAKYQGGFHSNAVNFGSEKYGSQLEFLDIKGVGLRHRMTSTANPFTLEGTEGDRLDPRYERAKRVLDYRDTIGGSSATGRNHVSGIGKRG